MQRSRPWLSPGSALATHAALLLAAVAVVAPAVAWRVFATAATTNSEPYDLGALFHPGYLARESHRIGQASWAMFDAITTAWVSIPLLLCALAVAVVARRLRPAIFLVSWAVISFAALTTLYVSSTADIDWHIATSADRVVYSVALGIILLAPVVAIDAWDTLLARDRSARPTTPR